MTTNLRQSPALVAILVRVTRVSVRRAVADDVPWILRELAEFSKFFGTKKQLFADSPQTEALLLKVLGEQLALVAEREDGEPMGFIVGFASKHPFNPDITVLSEQLWWVKEAHRKTRAGLLLLEAFIDWGKKHVDWITFGLEAKSPVRDETILRRGFRLQERAFLMEVR